VRAGADSGEAVAPRVIGIDDRAWKKGHRHGAIVCDLEHHRVIDILPDREADIVEAWRAARAGIEIVSRDRGGVRCPRAAGRRAGRRPMASARERWPCLRRRRQEEPRRHPQVIGEERDIT